MFIIYEHLLLCKIKPTDPVHKHGISLVKYRKMHLKNYEQKGEEIMDFF